MEVFHSEDGESPFVVKDDPEKMSMVTKDLDREGYAMCFVEGCGEEILLAELDSHLELHVIEEAGSTPEPKPRTVSADQKPPISSGDSNTSKEILKQAKAIDAWKELFHMPAASSSKDAKPKYDVSRFLFQPISDTEHS